jgi:hypothetical protein
MMQRSWVSYLARHQNIWNRRLHCFATFSLTTLVLLCVYLVDPLLLIFAPVVAWLPTLVGHFIEGNVRDWLSFPILSMRADIRLLFMTIDGTIDDEIRACLKEEHSDGERLE